MPEERGERVGNRSLRKSSPPLPPWQSWYAIGTRKPYRTARFHGSLLCVQPDMKYYHSRPVVPWKSRPLCCVGINRMLHVCSKAWKIFNRPLVEKKKRERKKEEKIFPTRFQTILSRAKKWRGGDIMSYVFWKLIFMEFRFSFPSRKEGFIVLISFSKKKNIF